MAIIGQPIDRVDGRLKVTGRAKYAAEFAVPDVVISLSPLEIRSLYQRTKGIVSSSFSSSQRFDPQGPE